MVVASGGELVVEDGAASTSVSAGAGSASGSDVSCSSRAGSVSGSDVSASTCSATGSGRPQRPAGLSVLCRATCCKQGQRYQHRYQP